MEEDGQDGNHGTIERVMIERDYTQGMKAKWETEIPGPLRDLVPEQDFKYTITRLNQLFYEAENYTCWTCLEGTASLFSCFALYLCLPSHYNVVSIASASD